MKIAFFLMFLGFGISALAQKDEMNHVDKSDVEMNQAIELAQATLDVFIELISQGASTYELAPIKVRLKSTEGFEHIWCDNVSYDEETNTFSAQLANDPRNLPDLKYGDLIRVRRDEITDWVVISDEKATGGYTIRVLRNRMDEKQKREFDKGYPYILNDEKTKLKK